MRSERDLFAFLPAAKQTLGKLIFLLAWCNQLYSVWSERDLVAFLPKAKIDVVPSVCTGASNMPPAYCIYGLQIPLSHKKIFLLLLRMTSNTYGF